MLSGSLSVSLSGSLSGSLSVSLSGTLAGSLAGRAPERHLKRSCFVDPEPPKTQPHGQPECRQTLVEPLGLHPSVPAESRSGASTCDLPESLSGSLCQSLSGSLSGSLCQSLCQSLWRTRNRNRNRNTHKCACRMESLSGKPFENWNTLQTASWQPSSFLAVSLAVLDTIVHHLDPLVKDELCARPAQSCAICRRARDRSTQPRSKRTERPRTGAVMFGATNEGHPR